MPEVSILIPCYNGAAFVSDAVNSALAQTGVDVEVVVVDDGSSDDSVRVLQSFGDRIRLETGPNRGACAARNQALALSTAEYIQFLDADDRLAPGKLQQQLPLLQNGTADMVLCKAGLFGDAKGERPEKRPHPAPEGDPFLYFARYGIGTPAPLHRRSLVEKSGGFQVGLKRGQEADFHLRIAALNPRLAMIDEILVWIRMHDGERITNRPADVNQIVTTLIRMADFMDQSGVWTEPRRQYVAERLLKSSRTCFLRGSRETAATGLERAVAVWPPVRKQDKLLRRILTRVFGIAGAETLVRRLQRLAGKAATD